MRMAEGSGLPLEATRPGVERKGQGKGKETPRILASGDTSQREGAVRKQDFRNH
jgi:hypothetical protein